MGDTQIFPTFAGMKARNILLLIVSTLIAPIYLASCGEDRWKAYAEQTATAQWIDDTMRVWYYWQDEMPTTDEVNYFLAPSTFFSKLLSKSDKFSTIDSLTTSTRSIPQTEYSYGFQFATYKMSNSSDSICALVLYVAEGSPADDAGLKRGDWIMAMNHEPITQNNYKTLYGASAMQLTLGTYDATSNQITALEPDIQIASARTVNENPIHYYNIYTSGSKQVGYLVYNYFSAGASNGGNEYNDMLQSVFQIFANEQVNEFILDLRYNNGGLLTCAQLLCNMLAPASALGQPLGYLQYNKRIQSEPIELSLSQSGINLNLPRLYVLTSNQTASASEMLINCLRPYMEVVVVGSTTVGKNVGSITFTNTERQIEMSPIVCKIYNAEMSSDYESGIKADYNVSESSNLGNFLPFGDINETMLNTALALILNAGSNNEEETENGTTTRTLSDTQLLHSSIERRGENAVRIK